jgi:hypothetical protein
MSFSQVVGPGQTLPVQLSGAEFYFTVLTGPVFCRPNPGGTFNQFVQGQGLRGNFTSLEIQNPGANAVVFQVFATPAEFIDRRLIPDPLSQSIVKAVPTDGWKEIEAETYGYAWPDLSGTTFQDAEGNSWMATRRNLVSIQCLNPGDSIRLKTVDKDGDMLAIIQTEPAAGGVLSPPWTLQAAGDFYLVLSTAATSAPCFEIYSALSPGFAGQPPS